MTHRTDELPIKIIHWEYYKSPESITETDLSMKISHVVKSGTSIANGLLFKSSVKFFKGTFINLNCIAEQVFINDGIQSFSFFELKSLMESAFTNFNLCFQEEYKKYALGAELFYTIKDQKIINLLEYLKKI